MSSIRIVLFKNSEKEFKELLLSYGVAFSDKKPRLGVVTNAGGTIEVLSAIADASPWGALAIVLVAWVKSRASRKVIVTTKNNEIFQVTGYSSKEVESMLIKAKMLSVIDAESNDKT